MRILATVPLLTACSGGCSPQPPAEFDRFRADLGGSQVLRLTVQWPSPTSPANIPVELELGPDGASAAASLGRVTTDGRTVKVGDGDLMVPLVDVAEQAADLYAELRGGLSESSWTPIDAPRLGPLNVAADAAWAELELPFDWARSERVQLAVDRDRGHLRYIIINTDDPPLMVSARPPRGGSRTVTLTEGTQLGLAVSEYAVGKP